MSGVTEKNYEERGRERKSKEAASFELIADIVKYIRTKTGEEVTIASGEISLADLPIVIRVSIGVRSKNSPPVIVLTDNGWILQALPKSLGDFLLNFSRLPATSNQGQHLFELLQSRGITVNEQGALAMTVRPSSADEQRADYAAAIGSTYLVFVRLIDELVQAFGGIDAKKGFQPETVKC